MLVHAEVEGEKLEEHEIVMGFFLLMAAGNDSTKATYCSGMRALMEDEEQRRLLLEDPSLVPDAVEESLRMFPAFAHFRRTTTREAELGGQEIKEGEKVVMWYVSSNRDETRYEDPDRFDLRRGAEHQAFGAGGRHFCLGTALARLELRILIEETLARYPRIAHRRRARVRPLGLHQPAEDAAGASWRGARGGSRDGGGLPRVPSVTGRRIAAARRLAGGPTGASTITGIVRAPVFCFVFGERRARARPGCGRGGLAPRPCLLGVDGDRVGADLDRDVGVRLEVVVPGGVHRGAPPWEANTT